MWRREQPVRSVLGIRMQESCAVYRGQSSDSPTAYERPGTTIVTELLHEGHTGVTLPVRVVTGAEPAWFERSRNGVARGHFGAVATRGRNGPKIVLRHGMKCRRCSAGARGATLPALARSRTVWGADRISGLRCSQCGTLFDADDIAKLLLEKQSQLERVGLLTPRAAVRSPRRRPPAGIFRLKKTDMCACRLRRR
jgi:hypothetical protein